MKAEDVAFVGDLAYRVPALMPALQEHLDDYDSLLPHVFMGDVSRWVVERYCATPDDQDLHALLDFIESTFETLGNEDRELIMASFLENLPRTGESGAGVWELIGPTLREAGLPD